MLEDETVNPMVTDGMTQANLTVLGHGPAISIAQTSFALAQSQGVLFANMVSSQQQQTIAGNAALMQSIKQLSSNNTNQVDAGMSKALDGMSSALEKSLGSISNSLATS